MSEKKIVLANQAQAARMEAVMTKFQASVAEHKLTKQEERSAVVSLLAAIALRDDMGSEEIVSELRAAGKAMLEELQKAGAGQ